MLSSSKQRLASIVNDDLAWAKEEVRKEEKKKGQSHWVMKKF